MQCTKKQEAKSVALFLLFLLFFHIFHSLVGSFLQNGNQLFGEVIVDAVLGVLGAEGIADAALTGEGLEPNASIEILTAADVTIVGVVTLIAVATQAGAEVIITILCANDLPSITGRHTTNTEVLYNTKCKFLAARCIGSLLTSSCWWLSKH